VAFAVFRTDQCEIKKYHTVRSFPKSNLKFVKTAAKSIPLTYICQYRALSWFGTGTSVINISGKFSYWIHNTNKNRNCPAMAAQTTVENNTVMECGHQERTSF
jgi:hypothetical protein